MTTEKLCARKKKLRIVENCSRAFSCQSHQQCHKTPKMFQKTFVMIFIKDAFRFKGKSSTNQQIP